MDLRHSKFKTSGRTRNLLVEGKLDPSNEEKAVCFCQEIYNPILF